MRFLKAVPKYNYLLLIFIGSYLIYYFYYYDLSTFLYYTYTSRLNACPFIYLAHQFVFFLEFLLYKSVPIIYLLTVMNNNNY